MFEIGFAELFLLGVIALLVVGPDRLPGLARTVGVWVGKAQRLVGQVRADIEREVRADEIRKAAKEYSPTSVLSDMRKEVEDLASEVSQPVDLDADEGGAGKPDGSDSPPGGRAAPAATGAARSEAAAAAKAGGRAGQGEAGAAADEPEPAVPAAGGASEPKARAAETSGGVSTAGRAADPEGAAAQMSSPPGPQRAEPPAAEPEAPRTRRVEPDERTAAP